MKIIVDIPNSSSLKLCSLTTTSPLSNVFGSVFLSSVVFAPVIIVKQRTYSESKALLYAFNIIIQTMYLH